MNARFRTCLLAGLLITGSAFGEGWLETRVAIEELAEAKDYEVALALGDELIALAREDFGDPSPEVGDAQMTVANLHSASGDYLEAEAGILQALDTYEQIHGPMATELIAPFLALGDNYHAAGDYALAISAYNEARSIGRRAWGLLNLEQIGILGRLAESAWATRDREEALALQQEALDISLRRFGEESPEFLAANYRFGEWLTDHYLYREAWLQYNSMERLLKRHFDDDPELHVGLLRSQAANFRRAGGNSQLGYRTEPDELEEALDVLEDIDEPSPALRAAVLRDLGDWNVAFNRSWEVENAYLAAWDSLAGVEDGPALRRDWFSEVVPVYSAPLGTRVLSSESDAPWGRLEAEFVVAPDGTADEIEILESHPPGLLDNAARQQILNSRYRPRIVDRIIVSSPARITWDFQYQARFVEDE